MQVVTFVDTQNQPMGTISMDVPRVGESVAMNGQGFSVTAVRYFIYPGSNAVRAAVLLVPLASSASIQQHYDDLAKTL
jgi:hypothetical protein